MEFDIEKCTMLIMKKRKIETREEIELLNQERIRTLRNYKYLGTLEADIIKQRWKETLGKVRKSTLEEQKNPPQNQTPRQISHQRNKHQDRFLGNILETDKERILTKDKENDDDA